MSVTLALFEQYDSQYTQTSQNTERPVTVFTSFLIIFLLNIYLFVKNTLSSRV